MKLTHFLLIGLFTFGFEFDLVDSDLVVIDYFIHEQTGVKQSKYLVTFWTKN